MDERKPGMERLRDGFVVELRRHRKTYDETRTHYADLDAYPTAEALLTLFADADERRYPEKERITRILLVEYLVTAEPHPLWSALLVLAYFPMVKRLRDRVRGMAADDGFEADQMALEAFLDMLEDEPVEEKPDRIALHMRQATERRLFAQLKEWQRANAKREPFNEHKFARRQFGEDLQPGDPDEPRYVAKPTPARMQHYERAMHRLFDSHVGKADLDLVLATLFRGEDLWEHVDRQHPASTLERKKLYERLKRQRTRTLARLRELLKTIAYDKSDNDVHYLVQALRHGDNYDAWDDHGVDWDDPDLDDEVGEATE